MADLAFVLDSSSSRSSDGWNALLHYVTSLITVNQLPIGGKVRVAVVVYGSPATVVVTFNQYSDISGLTNAVLGANYVGGSANLSDALSQTLTVFQTARQNVLRIAIVFVGGSAQGNLSSIVSNANTLKDNANNVKIIPIDISASIDLTSIGSVSPKLISNYIQLNNYNQLDFLTSVIFGDINSFVCTSSLNGSSFYTASRLLSKSVCSKLFRK